MVHCDRQGSIVDAMTDEELIRCFESDAVPEGSFHHPDHVREVAAQAGFELAQLNEAFLRYEYGEEVMGLYAVLRKPD